MTFCEVAILFGLKNRNALRGEAPGHTTRKKNERLPIFTVLASPAHLYRQWAAYRKTTGPEKGEKIQLVSSVNWFIRRRFYTVRANQGL